MDISSLWIIFSLSFLTALTGALSPGPLLTYTIIKTMESKRHGYLVGFAVIAGHAIVEAIIIVALLSGLSIFLKNILVIRGISIIGCGFLIFFGVSIIRNIIKGRINVDFLSPSGKRERVGEQQDISVEQSGKPEEDTKKPGVHRTPLTGLNNPVIGGLITSMSNPYWWIWWASIGSAFWVNFNISGDNVPGIIAFFLGHEAGDLVWYVFISFIVFFGKGFVNKKVYGIILGICGVFMILFGVYLGIAPFF